MTVRRSARFTYLTPGTMERRAARGYGPGGRGRRDALSVRPSALCPSVRQPRRPHPRRPGAACAAPRLPAGGADGAGAAGAAGGGRPPPLHPPLPAGLSAPGPSAAHAGRTAPRPPLPFLPSFPSLSSSSSRPPSAHRTAPTGPGSLPPALTGRRAARRRRPGRAGPGRGGGGSERPCRGPGHGGGDGARAGGAGGAAAAAGGARGERRRRRRLLPAAPPSVRGRWQRHPARAPRARCTTGNAPGGPAGREEEEEDGDDGDGEASREPRRGCGCCRGGRCRVTRGSGGRRGRGSAARAGPERRRGGRDPPGIGPGRGRPPGPSVSGRRLHAQQGRPEQRRPERPRSVSGRRLNYHRIVVGRDLWRSSRPAPRPGRVSWSRWHRNASRWVWDVSKEGDSTTSLRSLFRAQCKEVKPDLVPHSWCISGVRPHCRLPVPLHTWCALDSQGL